MDTCICIAESFHCSCETVTTLSISYNPIQNKKLKKRVAMPYISKVTDLTVNNCVTIDK